MESNVMTQAAAMMEGATAVSATWIETIKELLATYGMKLVAAIAVFVIGRWLAKQVAHGVRRLMEKSKVDETLISFVGSLTYMAALTFVIIATLSTLGIPTASAVAVLGAAGLAVGLALQGSLANFASGVLMVAFHPFKVGDFIEAAGVSGTVKEIEIFNTMLTTPDNRLIILPNASVTGSNIVNYSATGKRRVDIVAGCGYGDDIKQVEQVLMDILKQDERVLPDPAPVVALSELADSSVNFVVRPWVKTPDYWDVKFDVTRAIKLRFDAEKISIPFPQRDVHIYQAE
jgi:small conductance mechanosensitive channel